MVTFAVALLFLIAGSSASDAATACNVRFMKFVAGETSTAHLRVKSGQSCSIRIRSSLGGARRLELRRRPAHGFLTLQGAGVTYDARRGFVGKDRFEYVRHARDPRTNMLVSGTMAVEITVEP